jgi:hypothetical protein
MAWIRRATAMGAWMSGEFMPLSFRARGYSALALR